MTIKDSGDRHEFESGAVRDMHEGKGRYDLLPWEAIHELALHYMEQRRPEMQDVPIRKD